MDDIGLLVDFHKTARRQGPGGDAETKMAVDLARIDQTKPLKIADIGCGTGAPTIQLARLLNAEITAIDLFSDFIDMLRINAENEGLIHKINPQVGSMDNLPFADGEYDVIWSEGAIYNIGFEKGVNAWRRFLKPGGLLAVSEITWITNSRPSEIQKYWQSEYPEITTASEKTGILEKNGYTPIGYFVLPENCWLKNYYLPTKKRFAGFLSKHANSERSRAIVEAERKEIALYEKYKAYYGYGFYIARKTDY